MYVWKLSSQTHEVKAFTNHIPLSGRKPFVCRERGMITTGHLKYKERIMKQHSLK
jgi:hypothetical protein